MTNHILKRFYKVTFLSVYSGGNLQSNLTYLPDELQTSNFEHSSELDDNALSYKNIYIIMRLLYFIDIFSFHSRVRHSVSLGSFLKRNREVGGWEMELGMMRREWAKETVRERKRKRVLLLYFIDMSWGPIVEKCYQC